MKDGIAISGPIFFWPAASYVITLSSLLRRAARALYTDSLKELSPS
jgi:hypothetical protein